MITVEKSQIDSDLLTLTKAGLLSWWYYLEIQALEVLENKIRRILNVHMKTLENSSPDEFFENLNCKWSEWYSAYFNLEISDDQIEEQKASKKPTVYDRQSLFIGIHVNKENGECYFSAHSFEKYHHGLPYTISQPHTARLYKEEINGQIKLLIPILDCDIKRPVIAYPIRLADKNTISKIEQAINEEQYVTYDLYFSK